MAKKQDIGLNEILALVQLFGPQAQAERQQAARTSQLAQIASALNIAGGVQSLQDAPKDAELRRKGATADITARETSTKLATDRAPKELAALDSSNLLNAEQLAQLRAMAPLQQQLVGAQVAGATAENASRPGKLKREEEAHQSDLDYRRTLGSAQQTGAMAQMLPSLQALLATSAGTGTGKPGELVMTPEIRGGIMAKLMAIPELAQAFSAMQGKREDITRGAVDATVRQPGMQPATITPNPKGSWWESLGAFPAPTR